MKSQQEYIDVLRSNAEQLRDEYGVKSLRLFGSVARNAHNENSDVDLCVEMAPKMLLIIRLKAFLENLLHSSVDLVRMRPNMDPFLKDRDGVFVF